MKCPFCSADIEPGPDNCCQSCSVTLQDNLVDEDRFIGFSNQGLFYSSCRNRKVLYDSPENRSFKKELEVKKIIKACALTLGLQGLDERSFHLYRRIRKSTPRINSKGNMLIYTCMYIVARQEDKPIPFKRFSVFDSKVNSCDLGRIYKKVSARLELNLVSFPDDHNFSLCSSLYSSLFKGLQCEENTELLDLFGDLSGIDARKVLAVAEEVLRLSKVAMLNIGRDEAQLVAASLVIAFQSYLNIFLPKAFVKKLLAYQVSGGSALTRYFEIKEFLVNTLSYCIGESEVIKSRFYRYISALKYVSEDISKVSSTNPVIKQSAKEAVVQQIYTGLAKTKLELSDDLNDLQAPIFCHQEVLTRERALKFGFSSQTVSNLSLRDLCINLSDRTERKPVPPDDQELSSQDLPHSEFLELYVSGDDSAS